MLYVKWKSKWYILNEHQIGMLIYLCILSGWLIYQLHKKQKNLEHHDGSTPQTGVFRKVKNNVRLKINRIKKNVVQRRRKNLEQQQKRIKKKLEKLSLTEKLLDERAQVLIYSLRGGENSVDLGDKTYVREPDFAKCIPSIDPDHVYEVHDPVVLKFVRQLIVVDKKSPQIIDVSIALAASYKSQSIFKSAAGIAISFSVKSKGIIKNILDTAIIWSPANTAQYITILGYIVLGIITALGLNVLIQHGLLLMQAAAGIIGIVGVYFGGAEVITTYTLDCNHIISRLPASTAKFIPEIERPVSYVNEYNPSPYRVFVVGDKNLIVKKIGKPLPDSCYIGEEVAKKTIISQKKNAFGDDLACLQDKQKCQSEFEKISQQIDDIMSQNQFEECKQQSKNFDEATDVCAKYKKIKASTSKAKIRKNIVKS